jgi:hypothetical protein
MAELARLYTEYTAQPPTSHHQQQLALIGEPGTVVIGEPVVTAEPIVAGEPDIRRSSRLNEAQTKGKTCNSCGSTGQASHSHYTYLKFIRKC